MADDDVLDAALDRLASTGPEFAGFLSNHGPMAADALIRLGHPGAVETWVEHYRDNLEPAPAERFPIDPAEWREVLGDPSRLGDWCGLFARLIQEQPWQDLLTQWWPRLAPGAIASATHGLIRTGHAVRALSEQATPQRVDEFGRALAYWAARWQPLPAAQPHGTRPAHAALTAIPGVGTHGGIRTRLLDVLGSGAWTTELGGLARAESAAQIPAALDALVDAAVSGYGRWGHHNPVMRMPRPAPARSL